MHVCWIDFGAYVCSDVEVPRAAAGAGLVMAEPSRFAARPANRPAEAAAVTDFLAAAAGKPAALVVEGEPGIGKTTLWLDAVEQARERGFRVMAARTAEVEAGLAYASLADLLHGIDAAVLDQLPEPQKLALDRILLRVSEDGEATDQRAVSAAFLSIIEVLREASPVLIAIDDLQWLDPSSKQVMEFAARRLAAGVAVLCTLRTDAGSYDEPSSWLQLPEPDAVGRIRLGPLSIGALHTAVSERLGRSLPRPAMVQIYEVSRGNPFYAIEFARVIDSRGPGSEASLPRTLAEVVQSRIGTLEGDLQGALLAMACLTSASTDDVSRATDIDYDRLIELLEQAEAKGVIEIAGNRLQFAHPLLARGVYDAAPPAHRRKMHRRLAQVVSQPELRARHLALSATRANPATLDALDAAAEAARIRGAPAAAAELLELAMRLGGDTAERRIHCATYHFNAGDATRARDLLEETIEQAAPPPLRGAALRLLGVWNLLDGSSRAAAGFLERALSDAGDDLELRVLILVPLSFTLVNTGQLTKAARSADDAVAQATRLDQPHLLGQALGMRVLVRFLLGQGVDNSELRRALELEDRQAPLPALLSPTLQHAGLLFATGQLEHAGRELFAIRRRYLERGAESELMVVAFHSGLNEIWRGNLAEAILLAEDAMERALLLDRDLPLAVALMLRAAVASYTGDQHQARHDATESLAICRRCDSPHLVTVWPVTTLGFLDVSLGNHEAALTTLEPMLHTFGDGGAATEIFVAPFLPDAIEALIGVGRLDDAEPLIDTLEHNGRRLDRPWMLALGARCRSMLLAAGGDMPAALDSAQRAMVEHDRLPMPFERARTQLLLGQLQRRQRRKEQASTVITEALRTFEELGTVLWADRARAELARANVGPRKTAELTASEQRVAELAATGMTNRAVAAALFISPKTVEVNLMRIYRKLGIHSRAELGQRMTQLNK